MNRLADVAEEFYTKIIKDAVPQEFGKAFPNKPQFGDASKTKYSVGIPKNYFDELKKNISNIEILKLK